MSKNKLQQLIQEEFTKLMQEDWVDQAKADRLAWIEEYEGGPDEEWTPEGEWEYTDEDPGVEFEGTPEEAGWHGIEGGPLHGQEIYFAGGPAPEAEAEPAEAPKKRRGSRPSKRAQARWNNNAEDFIGGSSQKDYDRFYKLLKKHKIDLPGGQDYKFGPGHYKALEELAGRASNEELANLYLDPPAETYAEPLDDGGMKLSSGMSWRDFKEKYPDANLNRTLPETEPETSPAPAATIAAKDAEQAGSEMSAAVPNWLKWWLAPGPLARAARFPEFSSAEDPVQKLFRDQRAPLPRDLRQESKNVKLQGKNNMKLQQIIQEELAKLISELDQSVLIEQLPSSPPEKLTPQQMRDYRSLARLNPDDPRYAGVLSDEEADAARGRIKQRQDIDAATKLDTQVLDVQSDIAKGAEPQRAMDRAGISRDEYAAARRKGSGSDIRGIEAAPARRIADVDTADQKRYARNKARQRRRTAARGAGFQDKGDYKQFYQDLTQEFGEEGAQKLLTRGGKIRGTGQDMDFGSGHSEALKALQDRRGGMYVPLSGRVGPSGALAGSSPVALPPAVADEPLEIQGGVAKLPPSLPTTEPKPKPAPAVASGDDVFTGSPEQIGQGVTQDTTAAMAGLGSGGRQAGRRKTPSGWSPRMSSPPLQPIPDAASQDEPIRESKQTDLDRMKLLAGIKKKS